jgi:hypothetical protein
MNVVSFRRSYREIPGPSRNGRKRLVALDGIVPGTNERDADYVVRKQLLSDKVTQAWARFEVEQ